MYQEISDINRKVEEKRIAILIRFSHVSHISNPFRVAKGKGFDELAENIFDEERLRYRFYLFEKYCLPSLDGQINKDFCVILRCSTLLPDKWKKRLVEIAQERHYIYLNFLSPEENVNKREIGALNDLLINKKGAIITSRMDDDDALACNYTQELKSFLFPGFKGFAISYGSGFYVAEDSCNDDKNPKMYKIPSVRHINNSCGLAFVSGRYTLNKHVNNLNVNHLFVDRKFPTIINSKEPMFMMSAHDNQDTNRKSSRVFESCEWVSSRDISEEVTDKFPYINF